MRKIWTSPMEILRNKEYRLEIWRAIKRLDSIDSRDWAWALSAFVRDAQDILHIEIWDFDSLTQLQDYDLDLDIIFPDTCEDGRGFRSYLEADKSGDRPRRDCKDLAKLKILDAYARSTISQFNIFSQAFWETNGVEIPDTENCPPSSSNLQDIRYIPKFDRFVRVEQMPKERINAKKNIRKSLPRRKQGAVN